MKHRAKAFERNKSSMAQLNSRQILAVGLLAGSTQKEQII